MKINLHAVQRNFEDQLLHISFLEDYSTTSGVEQTYVNKSFKENHVTKPCWYSWKNWLDQVLNDQKELQYVLTEQSVIPTWPLGRHPD